MITQLEILMLILSLTCEDVVLDHDLETSNLDLDLDLEHFFLVTRLELCSMQDNCYVSILTVICISFIPCF